MKKSSAKPNNSHILTINGGSSSLKFALYEAVKPLKCGLRGTVDRIGLSGTNLTFNEPTKKQPESRKLDAADHKSAANALRKKTACCVTESTPEEQVSPVVLTIGHSTRALEEFIDLLQAHGAKCVVDVRTVPRSRHNPQFNKASLPRALKKAGLGYFHLPGLGGLRHMKCDSVNLGWRNDSFRGYADYMQTPEFEQSLEELIRLAKKERIAIMCAEAVPWRCHRSLIADALRVRGIRTEDILSPTRRQVHKLTPFAKVRGTTITYPAETPPTAVKKPSAKRLKPKPIKMT